MEIDSDLHRLSEEHALLSAMFAIIICLYSVRFFFSSAKSSSSLSVIDKKVVRNYREQYLCEIVKFFWQYGKESSISQRWFDRPFTFGLKSIIFRVAQIHWSVNTRCYFEA
jgi:hypothetical protein